MAELQASWIAASSHPSDTDRLVLEGLMNPPGAAVSGARYGVGSGADELKVQAKGTPDMSVDVLAGHVWIDGTEGANQGAYHCFNDATKNLAIAAAHATNPRKDLVVARVRDAQYSGGTNAWALEVVTGTPAASPTEPAVPANTVVLALVDVAALASSITNANITDRRRRAAALGGTVVCTSATRPTTGLYPGLVIYETDTGVVQIYNGSAWAPISQLGAWTPWIPTLTNLTLGNGSVSASYVRFGRTIHYRFKFTLGSTSGVGTNPKFTLPVPASPSFAPDREPIGRALFSDTATATYQGVAILDTGSQDRAVAYVFGAGGAYSNVTAVSSIVPHTWASTDAIAVTGTYEAAS